MTTTIVLLVSREQFLEEVYWALNNLICDVTKTELLCVVNGDDNLYTVVQILNGQAKFGKVMAVQVKPKTKVREYDIAGRRKRIASLHNVAKTYVDSDYVFGVEDDTIIPPDALRMLLAQCTSGVGVVEGVEMGRWGIPYIGAWVADDVQNPTTISSIHINEGLVPVDAGGFYCFVTPAKYYKEHTFKPFENGLGADVDYFISLRRKGLRAYADFDVQCIHKANDHDIKFGVTIPRQVVMRKIGGQWRQNVVVEE